MNPQLMTFLEGMVPMLDMYSIGEAFADLLGLPGSLEALVTGSADQCWGRLLALQEWACAVSR